MKRTSIAATMVLLLIGALAFGQDKSSGKDTMLSPIQIIERSQLAFYYQGDDMKAEVIMELIDKGGGKRTRVMTMLRRDATEGGNQKYFYLFPQAGRCAANDLHGLEIS